MRLIKGQISRQGEFPFLVSLRVNNSHICGGSLISSDTVLTAAHCLKSFLPGGKYQILTSQFRVFVGTSSLLPKEGKPYKIQSFHLHESFVRQTFRNDIAVIKVNTYCNLIINLLQKNKKIIFDYNLFI